MSLWRCIYCKLAEKTEIVYECYFRYHGNKKKYQRHHRECADLALIAAVSPSQWQRRLFIIIIIIIVYYTGWQTETDSTVKHSYTAIVQKTGVLFGACISRERSIHVLCFRNLRCPFCRASARKLNPPLHLSWCVLRIHLPRMQFSDEQKKQHYCCVEKLLVQQDPSVYFYISQGCLTVENINDQEEMDMVEVCIAEITVCAWLICGCACTASSYFDNSEYVLAECLRFEWFIYFNMHILTFNILTLMDDHRFYLQNNS